VSYDPHHHHAEVERKGDMDESSKQVSQYGKHHPSPPQLQMISRITYETKLQKSLKNLLLEIRSVTKQGLLIRDSEPRYFI
jgi:hypothetical protein